MGAGAALRGDHRAAGVRVARDILDIDTSFVARFDPASMTLHDLEVVRLILSGASVIDWHKLNLGTRAEVDAFLRLLLLDPDDPADMERLRFVFNQAVTYLEERMELRFPPDLRDVRDVRDVFIQASSWTGRFRRRQVLACTILKLMHVIGHMEAADLKAKLPISEAELLDRAERRIIRFADTLRDEGFPILAFYGSRKTRTSTITKLLAKREVIAATIFDKLRFRIVVQERAEILPLLAHLARRLFPFNYVIPDQSHNNLLPFRRQVREHPHLAGLAGELQRMPSSRAAEWIAERNPFSGSTYRSINFIVDFPVRIEREELEAVGIHHTQLGHTVFVMVEFQVLDKETAVANESGENAHQLYKERQRRIVEERLLRGARSRLRGKQ